jgi:hypothetical protein
MQEIAGYIHVQRTGGNSKLPLEKNNICIIIVYMRVNSLKPILYSLLFAWTVTALSVCVVEPIDLTDFVTDPKVSAIVEAQAQRVIIATNSATGITAGNKAITVNPAKYYVIEEYKIDEDETTLILVKGFQFVSKTGLRTINTGEIARVSRITGLTNGNVYRVLEAKPFTGNVSYAGLPAPPAAAITGESVTLDNGKITLKAPKGTDKYYLDFSALLTVTGQNPNGGGPYNIVKVPVSPAGDSSLITTPTPSLPANTIELEGENTTTDYVFALTGTEAGNTVAVSDKFFFLTVVIPEKKPDPGITLEIEFSYSNQNTKTVTLTVTDNSNNAVIEEGNRTFTQDSPPNIKITATITGAEGTPTYDWYYDKNGSSLGTADNISVNFDADNYLLEGTHVFTVFIKDNDGHYQADVTITVGGP